MARMRGPSRSLLKDQTGTFQAGLIAMAALLAVTTLLAWLLRVVIKEE